MPKQALKYLGLVLILAIGAGVYYFFFINNRAPKTNTQTPQGDAIRFTGDIKSMEGNKIKVHGVYLYVGTLPSELTSARDFSFSVDEKTQYKKTEITWPTREELRTKGTGYVFNIKDLPHSEKAGSLDDLRNMISSNPQAVQVQAVFPSSILKAADPVASSVDYEADIMQ